jgi:hypothetical protein
VIRHDNLSAATHELKHSGGRQLTERFRGVLEHYGLRSSRIQPGEAHENGVVEQAHFRTKSAVEQALLLRGHADFGDEATYEDFVREVIERKRQGKTTKPKAVSTEEKPPDLMAALTASLDQAREAKKPAAKSKSSTSSKASSRSRPKAAASRRKTA